MSNPRPDSATILGQLKDFQRDTVEFAFRRMYLDSDCARRFLVGDEVGLGKTLVARGIIAKTIDFLWDSGRRIDIVYVCSNADIARQNINRLNVTGSKDFELASRITLLPISLGTIQEKKRRLNFVSFTPGTSFEQTSGTGWSLERQLLYWLLAAQWEFSEAKATRVMESWSQTENFRREVGRFPERHSIHGGIARDFAERLQATPALHDRFRELCDAVPRAGVEMPRELRRKCDEFVSALRKLLAQTCLQWLQPDLVILDEFQRFRHLLSPDSPAGELAHDLFNYQQSQDDATSAVRVLLLSATPYKMYTLSQESGDDDHYSDFQNTLDFLLPDAPARVNLRHCVRQYREALYRLTEEGAVNLLGAKGELEQCLRRVMVRTERLALREDRNGMLCEVPAQRLELLSGDVEHYLAVQRVARAVEHDDILEYWKSAPYLLNFMEEYELKRRLENSLATPKQAVIDAIQKVGKGLLDRRDVMRYRQLDPANSRLRSLMHDTTGRGAWKLLWLPPCLPYYQGTGPFADPDLQLFTKRLVFSCWKVVPKAIAALLSYEAERRMMRSYRKSLRNTQAARKKRRPLLRFALSNGRLTGMPALMLVYPSIYLAREFDPLRLAAEQIAIGQSPTIDSLLKMIEPRLEAAVAHWTKSARQEGAADESWYWAAPILLDLIGDNSETTEWLKDRNLDRHWQPSEQYGDQKTRHGWQRHVEESRRALSAESFAASLGPPPSDLVRVLSRLALAGPGVCALRALQRVSAEYAPAEVLQLRTLAGNAGHSLLHLFNLPEVTAMVRDSKDSLPYWRRALKYCVAGNLQAVLDEYAHILAESEHFSSPTALALAKSIADKLHQALSLRTSTAQADIFKVDKSGFSAGKPLRMRTRFAMRFGDHAADDGGELTRADQVRTAFNSPFWPFVLATTSVGQEGLDFHPYCHAVVHWNLPSNPVDLEQREGRVHRYKGHALRKNIASAFASAIPTGGADPWSALFRAARNGRTSEQTDLYPYWVAAVGPAKIERHVLSLPHSRDVQHHANLRRSLVLYRMVFGQNRQEDLVRYLESRLAKDSIEDVADVCRIDLSPPRMSPADSIPTS